MAKSVVITGISSGIGYYLAKEYDQKGYRVFGTIRSESDRERLSKELPKVHLLMCDVTDEQAIQEAAKEVEVKLADHGLDILINNAGVVVSGPLMIMDMKEFHQQYDINVFGLLRVTQAFLPLLGATEKPAGQPGTIINISSVTGKIGFPFVGAYSSSKFAVEGLSHSLRRELLPFGIKVVIIGPASVKTPIWEKESATDIPEKARNSIFGKYIINFQKLMLKTAEKGLDPIKLTKKIVKISEKKKPGIRYAFAKQYILEWILPRYILSERMIDLGIKTTLKKGE